MLHTLVLLLSVSIRMFLMNFLFCLYLQLEVRLILTGHREGGERQKGRLIEFVVPPLQTDRYTPSQEGDRKMEHLDRNLKTQLLFFL